MVADVPRNVSLRRFPGSNVLSYYVIIIFIYNYTNNGITYVCIDLAKIKLFVFAFVFVTPAHVLPRSYSRTPTSAHLFSHSYSRTVTLAHLLPRAYSRTLTPAQLHPRSYSRTVTPTGPARPEVRGTTKLHGGAYPLPSQPPRTPSRHSSETERDGQVNVD